MASEEDRERTRLSAIEMMREILDVPEEWSFNIASAAREMIVALEANRPPSASALKTTPEQATWRGGFIHPHKPIVAIDVDGVLHRYVKWKAADVLDGLPVHGAMEALKGYIEAGLEVWIVSSRLSCAEGDAATRSWVLLWLCDAFGIVEGGKLYDSLVFSVGKPPAVLLIDDRAYCFCGKFPTPEEIKAFKPFRDYDSVEAKS